VPLVRTPLNVDTRGVESGTERWRRYRRAVEGEALPCAIVDLDAIDENARRLAVPVRAARKKLRVASKSIRCPALIRRVLDVTGDVAGGVMTYAAAESALLAREGFTDLLLAYPAAREVDAGTVAAVHATLEAKGGRCAAVVDAEEHVALLERAARERRTRVPVVVDVDVAYRPFAGAHVGVRRSPARSVDDVVRLASRAASSDALAFAGIMAYEAQIAGVPDARAKGRWQNAPVRLMKHLSRRDVAHARRAIVDALAARGLAPEIVNGAGTGSLASASRESALTEVTAGSGFLKSHLFDGYRGLDLLPAAYFAVAVARRPAEHVVTCHGGGWVASGEAGASRLPVPALPEGLRLLPREGAGEVQTPLVVPGDVRLAIGDPIFFRHAKAGELAEHVNEYLLVRGDRVVARAPTYRGLGHAFLG
jgi:D-serine deaminase-like pyridoxal phosphate-dependent protein